MGSQRLPRHFQTTHQGPKLQDVRGPAATKAPEGADAESGDQSRVGLIGAPRRTMLKASLLLK